MKKIINYKGKTAELEVIHHVQRKTRKESFSISVQGIGNDYFRGYKHESLTQEILDAIENDFKNRIDNPIKVSPTEQLLKDNGYS